MMFQYVNLENATDGTTSQVQDDDQESQENHERRRRERRDSKIPRKKKDMSIRITKLMKEIEENEQVIQDKKFIIEHVCKENERLKEWIRDLESDLNKRDQALSLANKELKKEKASVSRLQNEIEKGREANPLLRSDLSGLQSESQAARNMSEQQLSERIRVLEGVLNEKDQDLTQQSVNFTLANEELEKERASVSRLQNEIEKKREDLRRLQSESQDAQAVRNMLEQQLREKEVNFRTLQANLGEEQQARQRLEKEKERNRGRMRVLEISYSADKERLLERIRVLEGVLNEKDQDLTQQSVNLSLANEELEKERASVSRLQNEIEKKREDLRRLQSESQDAQAVRNMLEQQLREKEVNFRTLQANLGEEQQARQRLEKEKERNRGRMRDLEISYSADKERVLERIRLLEGVLNKKDQDLTQQSVNLSLANEELEKERASVSRLQNEIEKEREDLRRLQSESQDAQAVRNMLEQQLREKEVHFRTLQANLGETQQARQMLEEELLQSRRTCVELEGSLENERLLSQSNLQVAQTKEETIREQMRRLEQERELKLGLEERVRGLETEVDEERIRRVTTERERETYEQRICESQQTLVESERRLGKLQSAVSVAQEPLAEYRRLEPRDWIIRRDEVIISEKVLGTGAWGNVYQGSFRGCQVAVKQIHDLLLSPFNRRLLEREMSIASRCRHPNLLQFMGATNDDGSPLFVRELLDTDLRKVLSQRSLHHEEIVCLALDVAIALNYLHLNKPFPIIHRDIRSSNVLLWRRDDRWRAKLSGYGAADFMRQCMTSNPGARIYAAPEAQTSQQSPKVSKARDAVCCVYLLSNFDDVEVKICLRKRIRDSRLESFGKGI